MPRARLGEGFGLMPPLGLSSRALTSAQWIHQCLLSEFGFEAMIAGIACSDNPRHSPGTSEPSRFCFPRIAAVICIPLACMLPGRPESRIIKQNPLLRRPRLQAWARIERSACASAAALTARGIVRPTGQK